MATSGRRSVLPVHLRLNVVVSSRRFGTAKSRTAVNSGNGCARSRLTRCLSWRTFDVRSIEISHRSLNDGMLPEMIIGPT